MVRFVVCLDGTWNNAAREVERSDGSRVYRPSNVLKVARATRIDSDQITYYDTGVGSMNRAPTGAARIVRKADNVLGGALGAGFEINIEEAYSFLAHNYRPGDEIFVFGFSRGAAQARSLCRFIGWVGGFPEKIDAYYVPYLFTEYLARRSEGSVAEIWKELNQRRAERKIHNEPLLPIVPARIRYLGVWDTVAALGSRFAATASPEVAFHTPAKAPDNVEHIRHALAIDEARHDFRPEIFRPDHAGLKQRWFAGVHSNVGGGLEKDGLANCALHWVLEGATALGLAVDERFLAHYRKFPQDRASTKSRGFKILDTALKPLRGFAGERDLTRAAGADLDDSVFTRLEADVGKFERTMDAPYRPANLLRYLASQPQLCDRLGENARKAVEAVK